MPNKNVNVNLSLVCRFGRTRSLSSTMNLSQAIANDDFLAKLYQLKVGLQIARERLHLESPKKVLDRYRRERANLDKE